LQVGDVDLTFGDAERLRARATASGVDTTFSAHPEMIHGFQGLASAGIPEAHAALAEVAAFISARIR
jgi:acetyl esterase/lipase